MKLFLVLIVFLLARGGLAQSTDTIDVEKDFLDIIRGKNRVKKSAEHKKLMKTYMPLVTTSPATGTSFGVTGTGLWYMGDRKTTDISNAALVGLISTKKQVQLILRSSIFTKDNKWMLMSDWRYFKFSQPTFGLGSSAPGYTLADDGFHILGLNTTTLESGQMMLFNYLKLSQFALYKAFGPLYIGAGYSFDSHYDIQDLELDLTSDTIFVTSHYAYSIDRGFNPTSYRSSGFSVNLSVDTRDNGINSYKGHYAWLSYQINSEALGSSKNGGLLWLEYRTYLSLSKRHRRNVLALWTFANAAVGDVPYLDLPSTGWDMNGSSARGYAQGRYRGEAYTYAEAEWRFPISQHNGLWGGVLFANVSSLSNKDEDEKVFQHFNPAAGAGLRFKAVKRARMNFYLDYAFGQNGSHGLYFGLGEFF